MTFKLKNSDAPMMFQVFKNLKPWFVKRLKEWNTCTCQYHTALNELRLGLNNIRATRKEVHSGYNCSCETICKPKLNVVLFDLCCIAHLQIYKIMTSLQNSIEEDVSWVIVQGVRLNCWKSVHNNYIMRNYVYCNHIALQLKFQNN